MISPHDSPVFEPDGVHAALWADVDYYARLAGIAREWLWQPLSAHTGKNEVDWVRGYHTHRDRGTWGILYVGKAPGDRLDAMCGALVRNFVDARVRTLKEALDDTEAGDCTALFLPDFCVSDQIQPPGLVRAVAGLLDRRKRLRKQTVVYVPSAKAVRQAFGAWVADHLTENFLGDPR